MDALTQRRVWNAMAGLDTGPFGANLYCYEQVESTNDIARDLAEKHAPEGTLVVSDEQTAGRGRMGREWLAPARSSLLMSVIFRPVLPPEQVQRLVMACGLAVADACLEISGLPVDVKWPNDLLINRKKFTGILPESALVGDRFSWVIVGMGINVNQSFEPSDPLAETATSLLMETGETVERAIFLAAILEKLNYWCGQITVPALTDAWRERCITLGQEIQVQAGKQTLVGLAEQIDDDGALWLRDDGGSRHRVTAGEATLLR